MNELENLKVIILTILLILFRINLQTLSISWTKLKKGKSQIWNFDF